VKLEHSFRVEAPLERVWQRLIDVQQVAPCLPGAEITEARDDGSYRGTFSVRLGPTTAAYRGELNLEEVDEDARRVVMRANGQDKRRVTHLGELALFPDFSPSGHRITFDNAADDEIYEVTLKTGRLRQLTHNDAFDAWPVYSPDGSKIAFISDRTGVRQVWVMDVDGSDPVQLTFDDAAKEQLPDWSPDGSKIAFQSMGTGNGDLYVMDADGSDVRRLTSTPEADSGPAWSPDGTQVAFLRRLHPAILTASAIYVINADGTDERVVGFGTRVPAWQPRGVPD
jgi:TolB protein